MTREELKQRVIDEIEKNRDAIISIGQDIMAHPELGFKETRTSGVVKRVLLSLGLEVREGLAITGVSGRMRSGRPGPNICLYHG